jgi:hypothetical protein
MALQRRYGASYLAVEFATAGRQSKLPDGNEPQSQRDNGCLIVIRLPPSMTQAADPLTTTLTGQLPFILLLSVALAFPASWALVKLYRRAVVRSMSRSAGASVAAESLLASSGSLPPTLEISVVERASSIPAAPEAEALHLRALQAPWIAAAIYTGAGFCYATAMAVAFLASTKSGFLPLKFLMLVWTYSWPVVLTVNLVAASTRGAKLATTAVYFLVLAAIGAIAMASSPKLDWFQIVRLWLITNLAPTVLLLAFLNRRVRAVGPLVLTFMIAAVFGSDLAISIAGSDDDRLRSIVNMGTAVGLNAIGMLVALIVLGFALLGLAGWLFLRRIGARYERKKLSDQSITLDAIWLLFGVSQSIGLVFEGPVWILCGPLAFVVFKAAAALGFSLLGRRASERRTSARLLLLRVFSLGKRSERLFDALERHWRHIGSIRLIAGPDLATASVEPHEFLDFVSGKLARRFIDGPQTLALRISQMDDQPDQDRRFRVNDFFCYEDTWKMVLTRLVTESDAVLMDLRGFSPQNAGCVFEIDELINVVPLEAVVFVIDDSSDEPFLLDTMRQSWMRMRPASPNRLSSSGRVRLFRFGGLRTRELKWLLRALCAAASRRLASQADPSKASM